MALEQHPVPQQISSYQFRLIGDMTLKQFFQLAAGAGIGLLIYGSPLPTIIKWPLIIFFVLAGAAFAFLPVQDRPLSVWLTAFFRSVYTPTIFTWKREQQADYFLPEDTEAPSYTETVNQTQPGDIQAQFGEVASSFLGNLEDAEEKYLSKITGMFRHGDQQPAPASSQQSSSPVQNVEPPHIVNEVPTPVPAIPAFNAAPVQPTPAPQPVAPAPVIAPQPQPTAPVETYYRPVPKAPPAEAVASATAGWSNPIQTIPSTPPGEVDENKPIFQNPEAMEEIAKAEESENMSQSDQLVNAVLNQPVVNKPVVQETPTGVEDLETPSQANILIGKVFDNDNNPLANVIMEIKDEFGRPVRALKTDNNGKFRIVTPLHDGRYTIYTEKDDYGFEPIQLELQQTIVEPMIIQGKKI